MKNMRTWMLGAAVLAGGLSLGATSAHAAQIGLYVRGPVVSVGAPPCPGPGYAWVDGYYTGGYWNPGRWNYVGVRYDRDYARVSHDRDFRRDWDRDRGWNRGGDRFRDGDRGRDRR